MRLKEITKSGTFYHDISLYGLTGFDCADRYYADSKVHLRKRVCYYR